MSWDTGHRNFKVGDKVRINVGPVNLKRLKDSNNINMEFLNKIQNLDGFTVDVIEVVDGDTVRINGEACGSKNWGINLAHHFILEKQNINQYVPEDLFTI